MNIETLNMYFITEHMMSLLKTLGVLALVYPLSYFLARFLIVSEYDNPWVKKLYEGINTYFLGTPLLLYLFVVHFVFTPLLFLSFDNGMDYLRDYGSVFSGVLVLTTFSAFAQRDFLLAAQHAIPKNLWENGKIMGLSNKAFFKHIALPVMEKNSITSYKREFAITLKDSSLLGLIGFSELMSVTQRFASVNLEYAMHFGIVNLTYLLLTYIVIRACGLKFKDLRRSYGKH